jgi:hypothetical protein
MQQNQDSEEIRFDEIMFSSLENKKLEYTVFAENFLKSKKEFRLLGNTLCKYEIKHRKIEVSSSKDNGKTFRLDMYRPKSFKKRREIQTIVGDLAWHDALITTGM